MWGGEIFVPKIPSYRILDVAARRSPRMPRSTIVGIRPGEKLHEEMITRTDSLSTIEFDDYYVILPSLPRWDVDAFRVESGTAPGRPCEIGFSYEQRHQPRLPDGGATSGADRDRTAVSVHVRPLRSPDRSSDDDIDAVAEVLRSDWLTTGPMVDPFEERCPHPSSGRRHAVAVANGTAALHLACSPPASARATR